MVKAPLPSPRALLTRLMLLATQGVPWEQFFEGVADTLLTPSGCQVIEIILVSEVGPFRFFLGETERFRTSRDAYCGNTVDTNVEPILPVESDSRLRSPRRA